MALLGSSIDPSLFSNDYSGFAQAGAIQGQSYAQLGKDIGSAVQGAADMYQESKKQSNLYSAKKKSSANYIDSAITMLGDKDPAIVAQLQRDREMMNNPSLSLEQQVRIGEEAVNQVSGHLDIGYKAARMFNAQSKSAGGGGQTNAPTNDSYPWD
jgi:hypothetical protein